MKILVIRFSSIGDIVLTTPVLRCLKKKFPEAEIHYLTKTQFHPVLAANPNIDRFYLLDDNLDKLLGEMKAEAYDALIDLHKNLRTLRVKRSLGVKMTFSFDKLNFKKWMAVNLKANNLPDKHIVDRYFEGIKELGVENDGEGLDFYIREQEVYEDALSLATASYTALVVGALHATKQLPEAKLIELCEKLNHSIYVLGGKNEAAIGARLNELFPQKVVNLCGRLNLQESAYIVKHARKVISHDTGFMHIAAAFKKPILSVWGNTIPAFGMYPYFGSKHEATWQLHSRIFEVEGLKCRPCSKIGFDKCPKGHFNCMMQQDITAIAILAEAD